MDVFLSILHGLALALRVGVSSLQRKEDNEALRKPINQWPTQVACVWIFELKLMQVAYARCAIGQLVSRRNEERALNDACLKSV
jgi:hypothetical protein